MSGYGGESEVVRLDTADGMKQVVCRDKLKHTESSNL